MCIPDRGYYCLHFCMAFRFDKVLWMNRYIMLNRVSGLNSLPDVVRNSALSEDAFAKLLKTYT